MTEIKYLPVATYHRFDDWGNRSSFKLILARVVNWIEDQRRKGDAAITCLKD